MRAEPRWSSTNESGPDWPGGGGEISDEDQPGEGPGEREAAQDVESQSPVPGVADVARHQGGDHSTHLNQTGPPRC